MSFDEQLRHAFDSLTEQLREETKRRLAGLADELGDAFETERAAVQAQAAADARRDVEQEISTRVAAAVAAAEAGMLEAIAAAEAKGAASGRDAGHAEGRATGLAEGRAAGLEEGRLAGRQEGIEEGRKLSLEQGRKEGLDAGRQQGREEGFREGRADALDEGREAGLIAGREEGWKSGHDEGVKEGFEKGLAQGRTEGEQAGREATVAENRGQPNESALAEHKAAELAAADRLLEAIRAIDRAKSLTEILDTLVSSAGREAKRAAVLLVRGGQLRGWRFIGFGAELDEKTDVDVAANDAGVIAEAARQGAAVSADSAAANTAPAFAKLPPGRELLAVPVSMSGQIVAVLYADQGAQDTAGAAASPRVAWPSIVELLARHAARCLEATTAFRAAKVLTERPDVPAAPSVGAARGNPTPPRADAGDNSKEDPNEAARRYARLLVSEIKLYHEPAVIAGRKERDLMTRLGGEISRARVLYEQRVPAGVRAGHDYFHDELVKTLAGGDDKLIATKT